MDFSEISKAIIKGELDDRLADIITCIHGRKEILGRMKFFELNVGDRVRFVSSTKPAYLAGKTGRLTEHKNKKVVVDLDMPAGRFWKGIRTPVSLIERVEEEIPVTKPTFVKIDGPLAFTGTKNEDNFSEEMVISPEDVGHIPADFFIGEK